MKYISLIMMLISYAGNSATSPPYTVNCAMAGMNYVFTIKDFGIYTGYYKALTEDGRSLLLPIASCIIMEDKIKAEK